MPLQHLLKQNIKEAKALGLLDARANETDLALTDIDSVWSQSKSEITKFDLAISQVSTRLHRNSVTLSSCKNSVIEITRVFPVRDIAYLFEDLPRTSMRSPANVFSPLLENIQLGCAVPMPDHPSIDEKEHIQEGNAQITSGLNALRSQICAVGGASVGLSIYSKVLVAPGRACWIGLPSALAGGNSQFWRDRLGLEHYPYGEGRDRQITLGDRLVRVTFTAQTSAVDLPRTNAHDTLKAFPEDLWLVRPTVVHQGNTRFVQRHNNDSVNAPADEGCTIDIKDVQYEQGERELILMFGAESKVTWFDVELLDGIPKRQSHDLDHLGFVQVMSDRFNW